MKLNILNTRRRKIWAFIILDIIVITVVVSFLINRYWSPILASKVKSTVLESTDSLYTADFSDAQLHILQGKLVIYNLTLKPNDSVYRQRVKLHHAPNNLYTLQVKRIVFRNIHPLKLYYKGILDIGQIVISAPKLKISYYANYTADEPHSHQLSVWQRIKSTLRSLHIEQVLFNNVRFKYEDHTTLQPKTTEINNLNLTGNELLIDSVTQADPSRIYYFKEIQVELNNLKHPSGNKLYWYNARLLKYSTLTSNLEGYGVSITPVDTSVFTAKKIRNRFSANADSLIITRLDFKKLFRYRKFSASKLLMNRGSINIFTTRTARPRTTNRLKTFPNAAIHQLQVDFKLDTVEMRNTNIQYSAYGKQSHKLGIISFNNSNIQILNITNNQQALQQNSLTRIKLNTTFMNAGHLNAELSFNLTDSARSYTYKGTLGAMDLDKLNKISMAFGLIKIGAGKLDEFTFDIKGNRYQANGKIKALYHDLKVNLLKADTARQRYKHRTIASFMANALIIKHSNPDTVGATPRSFEVTYVRPPDTPFFKNVWKTLYKGIKASVGYDDATEKALKQRIAERTLASKHRKARRAIKRQHRAEELRHKY